MVSMNAMGTSLVGSWNRCKDCGSVESLKVATVLVPILPIARYRVLRFGRPGGGGRMISRLIPGPAMTGSQWLRLGGLVLAAVLFWAVFIFAVVQGAL